MSREARLEKLLDRWEELRESGREVSAKRLTRDCPELTEELAKRMEALKATDWLESDVAESAAGHSSPSASGNQTRKLPKSGLSSDEFLRHLSEIKLMSPEKLNRWLESINASTLRENPHALASKLVEQGKLTSYQASVLLAGKSKKLLIDKYLILDLLGVGGMGTVFRAVHRPMNRMVAFKILPPQLLNSPERVKRFHREVRVAATLVHPNVVTAYDADQSKGMHFLVMEYVPGHNLRKYVQTHGPVHVELAVDCILQAARGLRHAHHKGIVHRDIKPSNLILSTDGTVKVLDLGLARFDENLKLLSQEVASDDITSPSPEGPESMDLTSSGALLGTVAFMAPEQALDSAHADHRADIYSLGYTLYYLLTGESPYDVENPVAVVFSHREQPIPSIRKLRPDVPESLETVYRKMVAKKPADRQQSMAEVIAALEGCEIVKRESAISPPQPSRASTIATTEPHRTDRFKGGRFGKRWWMIAVVGLVLGLIGLGVWNLSDDRTPPPAANQPPVKPPGQNGADPPKNPVATMPAQTIPPEQITPVASQTDSKEIKLPGLIPRPAKLPGIRRWQAESISPRSRVNSVCWSPGDKYVAVACDDWQLRVFEAESGRLAQLFPGHTAPVTSVAWSPDGKWIATGSRDQTARLWSQDQRKPGPVLHMWSTVTSVAWDPTDNNRLACATHEHGIKLWDVAAERVTKTLTTTRGTLRMLAWSPDGRWIASNPVGDGQSRLEIWNLTDAEPAKIFEGYGGGRWLDKRGEAIAWSPDSRQIATQRTKDGRLVFLDVESGELGDMGMASYATAWSPDARFIASGGGDIVVVDAATGKQTHTTKADNWVTNSLQWDSQSRRLAFGGWHGNVAIFNTAEGKVGPTLGTHVVLPLAAGHPWARGFATLACSADDRWLATGSGHRRARLWEAATGRPDRHFEHSDSVTSIVLGPENQTLSSTAKNGETVHWTLATGEKSVLSKPAGINTIYDSVRHRWSLDGRQLAVVNDSGIEIRDAATGDVLNSLSLTDTGAPTAVAWDPQGQRLAVGGSDGTIRIWPTTAAAEERLIRTGHPTSKILWSPDGRRLGVSEPNERGPIFHVWDIAGGRKLWSASGQKRFWWSPDSRRLAAIANGTHIVGPLVVRDAETGKQLWKHEAKPRVQNFAWSPDGTRLAAFGEHPFLHHGILGVYAADDGKPLFSFPGLTETAAVCWSRDSQRLTAAGKDRMLRQWNAETGEPLWIAVGLPQGEAATFSPAGQLLHQTKHAASELAYVVENQDGSLETLSHDQFQKRIGPHGAKEVRNGS